MPQHGPSAAPLFVLCAHNSVRGLAETHWGGVILESGVCVVFNLAWGHASGAHEAAPLLWGEEGGAGVVVVCARMHSQVCCRRGSDARQPFVFLPCVGQCRSDYQPGWCRHAQAACIA